MPQLVWDRVGERIYENGLDRGVLYLPDGSGVPWNGLTSVIENFNNDSKPIYFDGIKINDLVTLGDFKATLAAVTYPDEFIEIEGYVEPRGGVLFGDQRPKSFGLCYRSQVGNDLDGDSDSYKIHIIYNVTAVPSNKTLATMSSEPSLMEFEWELTAVPEEVPGLSPTAHIVLDSRDVDPWLFEELESMLYGDSVQEAALLPMSELVSYIMDWYRVKITDHGDGTWTAESQRDGFISFGAEEYFSIVGVNAVYLDDVTFQISDTTNVSETPQIRISDNGNGTWSAQTDHTGLIVMVSEDEFEIRNANAEFLDTDTYRISDTTDD